MRHRCKPFAPKLVAGASFAPGCCAAAATAAQNAEAIKGADIAID